MGHEIKPAKPIDYQLVISSGNVNTAQLDPRFTLSNRNIILRNFIPKMKNLVHRHQLKKIRMMMETEYSIAFSRWKRHTNLKKIRKGIVLEDQYWVPIVSDIVLYPK